MAGSGVVAPKHMQNIASAPVQHHVPPGPSSWPLVGNVLDMRAAGDFAAYFDALWQAHGDTFRIRLFGTNAIVVAHPEALKHVLSTRRDRYVKGKTYDTARSVLGSGLVTLEGDAWKARRALAQPAFHRQSLAKLTAVMARSGARFLDDLAARAAGGPLEIDAHREMVKLTLDVVIAALLGGDLLRGADVSFDVLGAALELMSERANGVVLPSWIPTPHNLKFRRTIRELDAMMHALIGRARQRPPDGSLLSMLLSSVDAETGKALADSDVRDEVLTLFVAGHETTALTLAWLFTFLDGRPGILDRMRGEVDDVLRGRDPTFEDVPKLVYLRQVVEETLRLRPPAPTIARDVVREDEIGGYRVSPGDVVFPFLWATHRHPAFWPDAETFDPDRFSAERSMDRHSWAFVPFSGGPRSCIGNMFALVEASILLAEMLNRFDLDVQSCADVKPVAVATMRPSKPVRVVLRPRPGREVHTELVERA
jgi:cytochrome P450